MAWRSPQPIRPQPRARLNRMVMQRHREPRKEIVSMKHPVVRFHIEQLDGEDVRGTR